MSRGFSSVWLYRAGTGYEAVRLRQTVERATGCLDVQQCMQQRFAEEQVKRREHGGAGVKQFNS